MGERKLNDDTDPKPTRGIWCPLLSFTVGEGLGILKYGRIDLWNEKDEGKEEI